jgi:acid phosphatase (class A)
MNALWKSALLSLTLVVCSPSIADAPKRELLIQTTYLAPAQILPPPPSADSVLTRDEIAEVKAWVAKTTPEEKALAAKDALDKTAGFFADTVSGFDLSKLPATKALFDQVRFTEDQQAKVFKNHFKRPRPYITDPTITLCVAAETGGELQSYPSGHATMAYSMGVILAHLIEPQAAAIMERAKLYAENRMRCGVHHRSDTVAGQVLGTLVAVQLMQNAEFQTMFEASRQELLAAGLIR